MEFVVSVKADTLMARLDSAPAEIRRAMLVAVTKLSIDVQRSVKQDKLSGQALHVRSGTLRRSINREVFDRDDGVFAVVGTNVVYAHPHEYGFQGVVNVRAHVRRSREQMRMKKSNVKPVGNIVVRAHQMRMNIAERSFLRSTLKDFTPVIKNDLQQAALGVLK